MDGSKRIIHASVSEGKANSITIGGKVPELERVVALRFARIWHRFDKIRTYFPTSETDFVVTFAASRPAKRQSGVMWRLLRHHVSNLGGLRGKSGPG